MDDSAEERWLTPDPVGGDITSPQSLNRYAYALNNPETLTDPSGLWPRDECPGPAAWGCDAIRHGVGGSLFQDPFSLIGIPVVADTFTPPQLLSTVDFAAMGNANGYATSITLIAPGGFATTYLGDAFQMFGGSAVGIGNGGPPAKILPTKPINSGPSWWGTFFKSFVEGPSTGPGSCVDVFTDTVTAPLKQLQAGVEKYAPMVISTLQAAPTGAGWYVQQVDAMVTAGAASAEEAAPVVGAVATAGAAAATLAPSVAAALPYAGPAGAVGIFSVGLGKELWAGVHGQCKW
jgi:hypothetical protein